MLKKDCPLCQGTGEIIVYAKRVMGYTLAEGETEGNVIDEHIEECPLCRES